MATVTRCDRCFAEGRQVVQVLGKDLCNGCIMAFGHWVTAGTSSPNERMPRQRNWFRKIEEVARDRGHVTPLLLAGHTGCSERTADDALRYHRKEGHLIRIAPRTYCLATDSSRQ